MKILFATDGSDTALAALDFLLRFPLPEGSEIRLLTVIDRNGFPELTASGLSEEQRHALAETEGAIRQGAERLLAEEGRRVRAAGWAGSTEVRIGHPAEEIHTAAAQYGAELIVLGSHGHRGFRRFILGSVSGSVLQYAACSVLVVPLREPEVTSEGPLHILLAFDGSAPAEKAVDLCAGLPLHDRDEVRLLTVMPLVTLYRQDIRQRLSWHWQAQKEAAEAALERAAAKIRWATPQVSTLVLEDADEPGRILSVAAEHDSDLIVLGHKGRSALSRVLLGSVTGRIAAQAPCAVLAVRG
jgi:nucleotide-binding universal stress UspA family protein